MTWSIIWRLGHQQPGVTQLAHVSSEMRTPTRPPFPPSTDEVIQMKALWKLYRVPHKLNRHDYESCQEFSLAGSSAPEWGKKLRDAFGVQSEPPKRQSLLSKGVCVTRSLEAAFCPVPETTLSHIKALRRGLRCPSMLKTTFSFLGTRKPLFEKGPSTQISSFWSIAQENCRVQTFSFENGNILEVFL